MKRQLMVITTLSGLLLSANVYAKITFYCAPVNQITITPQQGAWEYLYNSPSAVINQGIQPSLAGWGDAQQALHFDSAVWTDGALACNYAGLTDQSQPELLVMMSKPLGKQPTCNFPTNGGKSSCDSNNPSACPMVCEELAL